ncbi:phosphomannomutase [Rhizobium sp. P32RR-XVIII]|uniref:phosphomannomutase n=1 Tax=Rhizobium sp. P32RR-XVIII TaxID=2726738 RepID=UPI00197D65C5|nr:phosphomannomutase [Rhizobium sp. P32RR-XVIII]
MKFGTSGVRGLVEDLLGGGAYIYATGFARHMLNRGDLNDGDEVLVGQDYRQSSPEIANICDAALRAEGLVPIHCGAVPTPALALFAAELGAPALMITGSHIPADRNGIKFYRPDGEIDKCDEAAIADEAARVELPLGACSPVNNLSAAEACTSLFAARNRDLLPPGALTGLKIGVYQHSTVARDLLVDVLSSYGATVVPLGRFESFIPVDTEALSPHTLTLLREWVSSLELDAIVSADGDGDRPLVADEGGTPLRGDLLGVVAAKFLGATTVVTPVTSNSGIENARNLRVVRTRVGSPYVIAEMNEAVRAGDGNVVGFEANGGFLTASPFIANGRPFKPLPTRDSFVPILAALNLMACRQVKLSEIAGQFDFFVAKADRLENFPTETSDALMRHLRSSDDAISAFLAPLGSSVGKSDVDGLRITLAGGDVIHFRPSGNAPEMRCYVESKTDRGADALLRSGLDIIRNWAEGRAGHARM